jgi:hypothetical protein
MPGGLVIPFIGIASIVWLLTSLSISEILATCTFLVVVCVFYVIMKKMMRENTVGVMANE